MNLAFFFFIKQQVVPHNFNPYVFIVSHFTNFGKVEDNFCRLIKKPVQFFYCRSWIYSDRSNIQVFASDRFGPASTILFAEPFVNLLGGLDIGQKISVSYLASGFSYAIFLAFIQWIGVLICFHIQKSWGFQKQICVFCFLNFIKTITFTFGNVLATKNFCDAWTLVACYQDDAITQQAAADLVEGKIVSVGRLPVSVCKFKFGDGIVHESSKPARSAIKKKLE